MVAVAPDPAFDLRPCCVARRILVPQPGIEPMPLALGAWSLIHWTARDAHFRKLETEALLHCTAFLVGRGSDAPVLSLPLPSHNRQAKDQETSSVA